MGEAIVWRQCTHPNLLPFYGIARLEESSARVCLVSPWMENGNVNDYLNSNPETPRLPLVRDSIHQFGFGFDEHFPKVYDILDGLAFLHRHGIVHGDLKGVRQLAYNCPLILLTSFPSRPISLSHQLDQPASLTSVCPLSKTQMFYNGPRFPL